MVNHTFERRSVIVQLDCPSLALVAALEPRVRQLVNVVMLLAIQIAVWSGKQAEHGRPLPLLELGKVIEHSALNLHEVSAWFFLASVCGGAVERVERRLAVIPVIRAVFFVEELLDRPDKAGQADGVAGVTRQCAWRSSAPRA